MFVVYGYCIAFQFGNLPYYFCNMIKICDRICRAYLVPVYSFGENNLYSQMTSDRARRFQDWFTDKFGFSPPMFYGRGLFQYSFGILPYREQVTTVGM